MTWVSLCKAAKIAGLDKRSAKRKLVFLKNNYPPSYKILVKKEKNRYKLHPEIIAFFKIDLRKNKTDLAKIISKFKFSDPQKIDLEIDIKKVIKNDSEINIEKEKNTKRVKTGGRKMGTPNRISNDIRKKIEDIILGLSENINQDLQAVLPKERLDFYIKALPYNIPKFNPVDKNPDQVPDWQKEFKNMTHDQKYEAINKLKRENNEKKREK